MNLRRHPRHLLHAAPVLVALGLLSACGPFDHNQSALDPKGPLAQDQYETFMLTLYVGLFLFVTVGGALAFATWRYRAKKNDENRELPKQTHGNPLVEGALILASVIILVVVAVPTLRGIVLMKELPAEAEEQAVRITVTGYQWWWEFEYPEEQLTTANELVIPVGRPVVLDLRAGDVIHSFWLPKLSGKTDLIPGQRNKMWIQADEAGLYWGQCAEFCGESHAFMLFRARAVTEEDYRAWIEHEKSPPVLGLSAEDSQTEAGAHAEAIVAGRETFSQKCATCHRVGVAGNVIAPNLSHLASRTSLAAGWLENTPENLYRWIAHSEQIKPGNRMYEGLQGIPGLKETPLTEREVENLTAYLSTLD